MSEATAYPGYATPTFTRDTDGRWVVWTDPDWLLLGRVYEYASGWIATSSRGAYVGLFPDKQAAGEALVKHAGYEVLG